MPKRSSPHHERVDAALNSGILPRALTTGDRGQSCVSLSTAVLGRAEVRLERGASYPRRVVLLRLFAIDDQQLTIGERDEECARSLGPGWPDPSPTAREVNGHVVGWIDADLTQTGFSRARPMSATRSSQPTEATVMRHGMLADDRCLTHGVSEELD